MDIRDKLYLIDNKTIAKAINIDDSLYEKIQQVINTIYDSTASELINVAMEEYIQKDKPNYFAKPKRETVTYRNLKLRKKNIEAFNRYHEKTGISFTRLINGCIKEFLDTIY